MEEKKAATQNLIESIGQEKAVVDAAVESSRGDEEAAATLQVLSAILYPDHRCGCLLTECNKRTITADSHDSWG